MSKFNGLRIRLQRAFQRRATDQQLLDEMKHHIDEETARRVAAGEDPSTARRRAAASFGSIDSRNEEVRERRLGAWLEQSWSDLRYTIRSLRKSPGFTGVAIATLALAIGSCTAMFSLVNTVLLKPLPFHEPSRLVWIENSSGGGLSDRTSRVDVFNSWREQSTSFEKLGAYFAFSDYGAKVMSGTGDPEQVRDVGVSDSFLEVLGVNLLHGRNFTAEECAWQGPGAVILSHDYWQRRFGGEPGTVGQSVTINNEPVTIVGVLAPAFDFDSVFTPGNQVDVLTPFPLTPETARWGNTIFGIGRLREGTNVEQAQTELTLLCQRLRESTLTNIGNFNATVTSLDDTLRGKFRHAFYILTGAVACVLAIACVNLSNLLLSRIRARRQEITVRIALGASRMHLIRQSLTESLLLAAVGSAIGVPLAIAVTSVLARLQTFGVPLMSNASVDPVALAVTVAVTTLAGIACGILPALNAARADHGEASQNATHQRSAGRFATRARDTLVVVEVALACLLLVGAGLLIRSFNAVLEVDLGYQPEEVAAWRLPTPRDFDSLVEANAYLDGAVDRVATIPGVISVGLSDTLPLGRNRTWGAGALNETYPPGEYPLAFPRIVDHHYLQTMRILLKAGRYFDARDNGDTESTIIINESLAQRLWPDRDAIGQKMTTREGATVIGVVADVRHGSLEETGGNEMYLNYHQEGDFGVMDMVVRSTRPLESLVPEVRAVLADYDPTLPTSEFRTLDQAINNAVAPRRLITQVLGFFSALALALAAIGLYGVIAYAVSQRTQEIGIRMAVGAQRRDVLQLILHGGLRLTLLGLTIGLLASLALARVLESQLFGISAYDPLTYFGNASALLAVALLACLLPALRATRIDPLTALRAD